MAKLPRKNQKVFAGSATNNGQFGSAQAGTQLVTNDIELLQALPAYLNGWNDATISGEKLPTLEEVQSLQYINSYQLAYLFQEGIPEYGALTEYHTNSVVKAVGTTQLYRSIVDNNTGNALANTSFWAALCDLSDVASKSYVDSIVAGLSPKTSVRLGTTGPLTANYANGSAGVGATLTNSGTLAALSLDGVTVALNNRVLVKNQANSAHNGIYVVTTVGSGSVAWVLTRATDYDTTAEVYAGTYTITSEGTSQTGGMWVMSNSGNITIGTTAITFIALSIVSNSAALTLKGSIAGGVTTDLTVAQVRANFGLFYKSTIINPGTTSYTPDPVMRLARARVQAASGASGGVAGSGTIAGASGASAAGAYCEYWFTAAQINALLSGGVVPLVVGAGGTVGAAGANAGNNGGNSSFGTAIVCVGGQGGPGVTGVSTGTVVSGTATGGTVTTAPAGAIIINGGDGGSGIYSTPGVFLSMGAGGDSGLGIGGLGYFRSATIGTSNGITGKGYGSGVSSAFSFTSTSIAGLVGRDGVIIIEEFA